MHAFETLQGGMLCQSKKKHYKLLTPVDVLLNVSRHVEVDHVLHVGNVETPRGYRSCHNDWCLANFEPEQRLEVHITCGRSMD